ncbi:MAG: BamA/TamA family outer membrane protein, partial [Paludibacteraceae bacterium]|nr:BamA/TamA family outer membrane protein [Paludibacteraceae bacterium]
STKWINRTLKKMGEAPEVFDAFSAGNSIQYLTRAMQNMGYFDASVDTTMQVKNRKLNLIYNVTGRQPYILRSYSVRLPQQDLKKIAVDNECLVKENERFDANILDDERARITTEMRKNGYYYFEKDYLQYDADSAYRNHTVTVQLRLRDYVTEASDSLRELVFSQFVVDKVNFYMDHMPSSDEPQKTVRREEENGYSFSYAGTKLIRNSVLKRICRIVPGKMYNQELVERTYSELTALGPVKYTDISFVQTGKNTLECNIVLSRSKLNSVSVEAEGTFSAGDWGIAGGAGYTNKNLFHGAEEFNINANVAYEWRKKASDIFEVKADASLAFPRAPKVSIGYQFQNRPDEFTRTIANARLNYDLPRYKTRWQHSFSLVDISYVYLPWISQEFRDYFLKETNPLRHSYEDHFILGWGYSGSYSSFNKAQPLRSYVTLQYGFETAGNLLYGLSKLFNQTPNPDGSYNIFSVRYAQYVKADLSFAWHNIFNEKHRLVYHAAFGFGAAYGNAVALPYEKRYFAGGANSVRGWAVRTLGPGTYVRKNAQDYNNQVGDIKMEMSLEYRWRVWSIIELAAFTDAGNIWTLYDYDQQQGGQINKDFMKEIGWSYGAGIRLDFNFFVFRVDFGVKLYDPGRIGSDGLSWRTAKNGLNWKDDCAVHFAIGYPF